jgi:hypothetical protein
MALRTLKAYGIASAANHPRTKKSQKKNGRREKRHLANVKTGRGRIAETDAVFGARGGLHESQ